MSQEVTYTWGDSKKGKCVCEPTVWVCVSVLCVQGIESERERERKKIKTWKCECVYMLDKETAAGRETEGVKEH